MSEFTVLTAKQIAKFRKSLEKADASLVAVHAALGGEAPAKKRKYKARAPKAAPAAPKGKPGRKPKAAPAVEPEV